MKNQISIINVAGAAVSATLFVSSWFLPSVNPFSFTRKITIPQSQKMPIPQKQTNLENNKKIVPTISSAPEIQKPVNNKEMPQKIAQINEQKQELKLPEKKVEEVSKSDDKQKQQLKQPEVICEEASKSNGCPKNLAYFTMKPRPKQMPEECFSCGNIIACACLTSKQSK